MSLKDQAVIVICTRTDSVRLPGKVFKKLAGVPAIEHILRRIRLAGIETILAVPHYDQPFYRDLAKRYDVNLYCGDAHSPLHRMQKAVEGFDRRYIVRITHDDILIDVPEMENLLKAVDLAEAGYGVTEGIVDGAGVEIFRRENLDWAVQKSQGQEIEHISYFVKGAGMPHPKIIRNPCRAAIARPYRLTMDYPEDVVVLEAVFRELGADADNEAICAYLDGHKNILRYNKLPELTVYTCAYNAQKYIRECMLSVLNNEFKDMEYLVVEDCSTDKTLTEIMAVASAVTNNTRLGVFVNEKNGGLATSSNIAIRQARGRYILRLDADDVLLHEVPPMLTRIKETQAAVIYPNYCELDDKMGVVNMNSPGNVYHHAGGAIMDKKLLNELKFREGLKHWDSVELYKRIKNNFPIEYYDQASFVYRKHSLNMSKAPERAGVLDGLRKDWTMNATEGTATSYHFT